MIPIVLYPGYILNRADDWEKFDIVISQYANTGIFTNIAQLWWECNRLQTRLNYNPVVVCRSFPATKAFPIFWLQEQFCNMNVKVSHKQNKHIVSPQHNFPSLNGSSETVWVAFWPLHKSPIVLFLMFPVGLQWNQ